MKRICILLFIVTGMIPLFADGRQERDRQAYGQIQLKVVNLTSGTIRFHFNKLYDPWEIKSQEKFVTMNTPINNEYPGFIGIEYNNRDIIIYRFHYYISERRFLHNLQYFVLVMETNIQFIEGNIDEQIDCSDESLYESRWKDYDWRDNELLAYYREHGFPIANWAKERLGEHFINITIENNSGSRKAIGINTVVENSSTPRSEGQRIINIEDEMIETYTIDYLFYQLGGVEFLLYDGGWIIDRININLSSRGNYEIPSIIELKLNANGYEIVYRENVSFFDIVRNRSNKNN
jgi:hypothetical protein